MIYPDSQNFDISAVYAYISQILMKYGVPSPTLVSGVIMQFQPTEKNVIQNEKNLVENLSRVAEEINNNNALNFFVGLGVSISQDSVNALSKSISDSVTQFDSIKTTFEKPELQPEPILPEPEPILPEPEPILPEPEPILPQPQPQPQPECLIPIIPSLPEPGSILPILPEPEPIIPKVVPTSIVLKITHDDGVSNPSPRTWQMVILQSNFPGLYAEWIKLPFKKVGLDPADSRIQVYTMDYDPDLLPFVYTIQEMINEYPDFPFTANVSYL